MNTTHSTSLRILLGAFVVVAGFQLRAQPAPPKSAKAAAILPFKISVPDSVLRDLKERLARTRWPESPIRPMTPTAPDAEKRPAKAAFRES